MISAPASGQGKTSITAAIARWHARQGQRVRVFKTGPDFIDPMILARASGQAVYQLDLFMGGLEHCRRLLHQASLEADLILVEGVMGLFDGVPSSADLAAAFGLPVLTVIDASAMAQTFAALATGLARFRPDVRVCGVVANRVGSDGHARMVGEALPADLPLVAALKRQPELSLPERHLGLVQAMELPGLDAQLDAWADIWGQALSTGANPGFEFETVALQAVDMPPPKPLLQGRRIAIAQDAAFSFIYPANLDCLRALGAELLFFSPLAGEALPDCDAVWLPGGYPELHAATLAANDGLKAALRTHHSQGRPLLAECGGLLSLLDGLQDVQGRRHAMWALLPGEAQMQKRVAALGLQAVSYPDGELRGHSFHYSTLQTPLAPIARGSNPNGGSTQEAVYRVGSLTASYIHHYFPSQPEAAAALFSSPQSGASTHGN
ncbi:hydrogenobyrinic acid a,c-diamide synthase (glutamine-hydrolysing) /cobyrinate a,c-diamide synthase [Roseateles toxinivorans]|uniref:Hydrogenobyrinic acid a,c-diamide synthase (Glutamine-hydrolysing) /cobyrinate a,c-diamide synthase n=2 Tax=Roseateles toxinivorans TaxID=270368 RepID=A0A4R6QM66_9BURK|nr:hydrogenobyrinic acid a,c-diamide synthase (glutamine-hydrolysing) /cobyrinate a,c-diamide synthase [Roseateles toxinivorans]